MKYAVLVALFVLFIGTVQAAVPPDASKLVCAHWNEWEAGDDGSDSLYGGMRIGFSIGAMVFVTSPRTMSVAGFKAELDRLCETQPGLRLSRAARQIRARR